MSADRKSEHRRDEQQAVIVLIAGLAGAALFTLAHDTTGQLISLLTLVVGVVYVDIVGR